MTYYFKKGWNDAKKGIPRQHHIVDGLSAKEMNKVIDYNNGYDAYLIDSRNK